MDITKLEEICKKYDITALDKELNAIKKTNKSQYLNIAVVGQFKAGKSSFINNIIGENLLPTGVLPTTSIITVIENSGENKISVIFKDKSQKNITADRLADFISEEKNPKNEKNVLEVLIKTKFDSEKNIRLIDTPGLGSVFEHNTQETIDWLPETGKAIILVSAVNPLSQNDLDLIKTTLKYSPDPVIAISKIDLIEENEQNEIVSFFDKKLSETFNKKFKIYTSSKFDNSPKKILKELISGFSSETQINNITQYKIIQAIKRCIDFLKIKLATLQKSKENKENLQNLIFDKKFDKNLIRKEIELIKKDYTAKIRKQVEKFLFENYKNRLIDEITNDFDNHFATQKGNLRTLTEEYENWIKKTISEKIKNISDNEMNYENFIKDAVSHLEIYLNAFKMRLHDRIFEVLGVKLDDKRINLEIQKVESPNTAVTWAFDTKIELLWFIVPMFIFRKPILKHFRKQINDEVEKNLYRFTSEVTNKLNKAVSVTADNVFERIENDLDTILHLTKTSSHNIQELETVLEELRQMVTTS